MIHKTRSRLPNHVQVVFELPACVWADKIFLSGEFNDWHKSDLPMRQERDGVWRVAIDLPAGKQFAFRYIVDGHWQTDYHADGCRVNKYGSEDSLVITEMPAPEPIPAEGKGLIHEHEDEEPSASLNANSETISIASVPPRFEENNTQPVQ